jgi:UPF0755 protein
MTERFDKWTPPEGDYWSSGSAGSDLREWSKSRPGGSHRPPRRPRRDRGVTRVLIVFAFLVCIAILVAGVIGGKHLLQNRSDKDATSSTAVESNRIVVKSGMGVAQVGKMLQEKGFINSAGDLVDLMKARGTEGSLKPGAYEFPMGTPILVIVEALEKGSGSSIKITIPEGMAVGQVADLLEKGEAIDGSEYARLSKQPDSFAVPLVGPDSVEADSLEGLLFPSTYFLVEGDDAKDLIGAQLAAFELKTATLPWSKAEELGVTPYQIVIIASMIEKEANIKDERAKVAAVIYNRLQQDMSLGIDATVRYALDKWTGPLTESDLKVDSPFNTRVKKGLPPAPIASPGLEALKAALEPAKVDYLYYVLIDTEGHHFFTDSYDEFLKAKQDAPPQ